MPEGQLHILLAVLHICPDPLAEMIPSLQMKIRWERRSWLFTIATHWPITLTGQRSPAPETDSWNAEPNPEDDPLVHQLSFIDWSAGAAAAFHPLVSSDWKNWRACSDLGWPQELSKVVANWRMWNKPSWMTLTVCRTHHHRGELLGCFIRLNNQHCGCPSFLYSHQQASPPASFCSIFLVYISLWCIFGCLPHPCSL